jgi:hypothetical protein
MGNKSLTGQADRQARVSRAEFAGLRYAEAATFSAPEPQLKEPP